MRQEDAMRMVEDVIGCKWTLAILEAIQSGKRRPGQIRRSIPGLSTKVMNERVTKLRHFGLLERKVYPESPPRVEYSLTRRGLQFNRVLEAIERFVKKST